ncbi:MAG: class I SAM-dependent methyltransferase [Anaerolineaceae bacterium]|nr:class I SAM-dependent methyltransferase [Anaerolineaceae bacterium]
MEQHKTSMTALVSAFARAFHAKNDYPLIFNDALAYEIIGEEQYQQIAQNMLTGLPFFSAGESVTLNSDEAALKWIVQTQLAPTPLARARYCEDMLQNAIQLGCTQYVILGAGLDTFAFRHSELLEKISVYELDHPATHAFKQERIQQLGWNMPDNYQLVPINFVSTSLPEVLSIANYQQNQRSFFSWLGVLYYLDQQTIANTLTDIATISAQGSSIMFDYPNEQLFTCSTKRVQSMLGMAHATGEPMKSCFAYHDLEAMLEMSGFLLYEHLSTSDIEKRFFQGRDDHLHAFETVEYALAVKY